MDGLNNPHQAIVVNNSSTVGNTSLRITQLGPPGPESSFLDWEWALMVHFRRNKLAHVLHEVAVKDRPESWEDDNITVISILTQACHEVNFKYL